MFLLCLILGRSDWTGKEGEGWKRKLCMYIGVEGQADVQSAGRRSQQVSPPRAKEGFGATQNFSKLRDLLLI